MPQCRCRVSIGVNAYAAHGASGLRYALWDSDLERLVPFRFAAANSRCLRRINQHSGD